MDSDHAAVSSSAPAIVEDGRAPRNRGGDKAFLYDAFISYRHIEPDRRWAKWLHSALEKYRVPGRVVKTYATSKRLRPIFRDEEELHASADLSREIESALLASKYLIVVCSPRTPESEWINKEIMRFRELGRHDQILALLIEGEPHNSFPRALRAIRRSGSDPHNKSYETIDEVEPLAADVRRSRKDESHKTLKRFARLRMLACILGVSFDTLRQRDQERTIRRLLISGCVACAAALLLAILSFIAVNSAVIAERRRQEADIARAEATRQSRNAKATSDFIIEMVVSASPHKSGDSVTLIQAVRSAVARLPNMGPVDPDLALQVRSPLALTLGALGHNEEAEQLARQSLALARSSPSASPETISGTLVSLATFLDQKGDLEGAENLFQEALQVVQPLVNGRNSAYALIYALLADIHLRQGKHTNAENEYRNALADLEAAQNPNGEDIARTKQGLAKVLREQKRYDESRALAHQVLATQRRIFNNRPSTDIATTLGLLGVLFLDQNQPEKAEPLFREQLGIYRLKVPPGHFLISPICIHLGIALNQQGKNQDAEAILKEALEINRTSWPSANEDTGRAMRALADVLYAQEKFQEAESILREELVLLRKGLGTDSHLDTCLQDLARVLEQQLKHLDAEPFWRELVRRGSDSDDSHSRQHLARSNRLARCLFEQGKLDEAEQLFTTLLDVFRELSPPDHGEHAFALDGLEGVMTSQGRLAENESLLEEELAIRRKMEPSNEKTLCKTLGLLGAAKLNRGQSDEAELLFREALAISRRAKDEDPVERVRMLGWFANVLIAKNQFTEAESVLREALAIVRKKLPNNPHELSAVLTSLAFVLDRRGKSAEGLLLIEEALLVSEGTGSKAQSEGSNIANLKTGKALMRNNALEQLRNAKTPEPAADEFLLGHRLKLSVSLSDKNYPDAETIILDILNTDRTATPIDKRRLAEDISTLGLILFRQAKHADAEAAWRESLDLRRSFGLDETPKLLNELEALALVLNLQEKYPDAERFYREALTLRRKASPEIPGELAKRMTSLANCLALQGRQVEAEELLRDAVKGFESDPPSTGSSDYVSALRGLAKMLLATGRGEESERLFQIVIARDRADTTIHRPLLPEDLASLESLYYNQGKYSDAEPIAREVMRLRNEALPQNQVDLSVAAHDLATVLLAAGKIHEAEPFYVQALDGAPKDDHAFISTIVCGLAEILNNQKRWTEAEHRLRQSLKELQEPVDAGTAINLKLHLVDALTGSNKLSEADNQLKEVLDSDPGGNLSDDQVDHIIDCLAWIGVKALEIDDLTLAERSFLRATSICRRNLPAIDLTTANALSGLGRTLFRAGRNDEAERLLREALVIRSKLLGKSDERTSLTAGALADVLHRQGRAAEESEVREIYEVISDSTSTASGEVVSDPNVQPGSKSSAASSLQQQPDATGEKTPAIGPLP